MTPTKRRLAAIVAADVAGYSRLIGRDEEGTLLSLRKHREDLIDPLINEHSGRIANTAGDSLLLEFLSAVDAVRCSLAVQQNMARFNDEIDTEKQIWFRIGINVGDVVAQGKDLLGDGVNVAARLENLSEPGGLAISDNVYDYIRGKVPVEFLSGGLRDVKNIERPVAVWFWQNQHSAAEMPIAAQGKSTSTDAVIDPASISSSDTDLTSIKQDIRYCGSSDGTLLAYAFAGHGQPLFKAQHFFTDLEYEWTSPLFKEFYRELAVRYQVVRQDQRGNGLSDRNPNNISFEHFIEDFTAVADASGIERFPIYALSQGAGVAVSYAVRNPERVSALILHGGYVRGRFKRGVMTEDQTASVEALITLIRTGWGQNNPAFRHMFTNMFIPNATTEQMDAFDEQMHIATDPTVASEIFRTNANVDIGDILHQVKAPTLVLHSRNDLVSPFDEGERLARLIPNAELVELDTPNHLIHHNEPEMYHLISEIDRFLETHPA